MGNTVRLKICTSHLPGFSEGEEVVLPADEHGTPLDQYWRRRLRDAEKDGCVERLERPTKRTSTKATKHKKVEAEASDRSES